MGSKGVLVVLFAVAVGVQHCMGTNSIRDTNKRWRNNIVYYEFADSITNSVRDQIRKAMDIYEEETCLFFFRRDSGDRIRFVNNRDRCWSSSIGRGGGRQRINLADRCTGGAINNLGTILHEIGHAIGLFHEHQRPDRGDFVRVYMDRVRTFKKNNFRIKNWSKVDNQGLTYDHNSIMHYTSSAFAKSDGPQTTIESRDDEIEIGRGDNLTTKDILTVNRMYNCPNPGLAGRLTIRARFGFNLPNRGLSQPEAYMKVVAVDSNGNEFARESEVIRNDDSPIWAEDLNFGARDGWQFFRVQVLDKDTLSDDVVLWEQLYRIYRTGSINYRLCEEPGNCGAYAELRFTLVRDGDECDPNPCLNSGTCIDLISDYRCNCRTGYRGHDCETPYGRLDVRVLRARNLPDLDNWPNGDSDPYVLVTAWNEANTAVTRRSDTIAGNHNPIWNEDLEFPENTWVRFRVQIFDRDTLNSDDQMLTPVVTFVGNPRTRLSTPFPVRLCGGSRCSRSLDVNYNFYN